MPAESDEIEMGANVYHTAQCGLCRIGDKTTALWRSREGVRHPFRRSTTDPPLTDAGIPGLRRC